MKGAVKFVWGLAALVVLGSAAFWLGARLSSRTAVAGTELKNPVKVSGYDLVDTAGKPVDLAADFRGSVTLVFFGYTRCPDVCPLTMARLARAYELAGAPPDLDVVMVTVDPGFDTPAVLAEYLGRFNPAFVGLSGSNSQVAAAARAFFVGYSGAGSSVAHTDVVAVVDRQGFLRYIYGQDAVVQLGEDLPALLRTL